MKLSTLTAWLILAILLLVSASVSAETKNYRFGGYVVTKDGQTIAGSEIVVRQDPQEFSVEVWSNGLWVRTSIPFINIKKIVVSKYNSGYAEEAVIYLRDGREFKIKANLSNLFVYQSLELKVLDPISNELKNYTIPYKNIFEFVFSDNFGQFKVDSRGNVFPGEYIYSPYTGEKLDFGQHDSSL
ncbi:MAG: hypothetical protein EOM22_00270 [Gammaproteobacteria bacterium]|nr:hypothetical protein [Gammaproteobacteria bacterium]